MISSYFTNLENIVITEIRNATKSIEAAVAWINFEVYAPILKEAIGRGVNITILINNDDKNQRYLYLIEQLNSYGATIRFVNCTGIMHHKFCVIDRRVCMFGSFNWTMNAHTKNIEDLNICDDINVVINYLLELEALCNLNKSDIKLLRNPLKCTKCGSPVINILFMEQERNNMTKIEVMKQCSCAQKVICTEYYDVGVYTNYLACIHSYEDLIINAKQNDDKILYQQLVAQQDFKIANYLSNVRQNRMGLPIIHAVGIKKRRFFYKDEEEFYYEIIWKERGTQPYIKDEYTLGF